MTGTPPPAAQRAPADLRIRIATDDDAQRWSTFVERCAQATVFHQWGWRAILERVFRHRCHYLIACAGEEVVGVLPLAHVKAWPFGNTLLSLPFCSWAGTVAERPDVADALEQAALDLAQELSVDQLSIRRLAPGARGWPVQDLYVVFQREISPDHTQNMNAIPRKQRAMVRKGIAAGLSSAIEDVDGFYPLYLDNMHRHGTPACPRKFFVEIQRQFPASSEFLVVRDPQGHAISGVLNLYFRDQVFPFYAGDTSEARRVAANDFKYWEVMRRAADRGYRSFNYGRSKKGTGSYDFKRNWGFEPQPLYYEQHLVRADRFSEHNPLNPRYSRAIEIWQKLPRFVVDRLGPALVRGLG